MAPGCKSIALPQSLGLLEMRPPFSPYPRCLPRLRPKTRREGGSDQPMVVLRVLSPLDPASFTPKNLPIFVRCCREKRERKEQKSLTVVAGASQQMALIIGCSSLPPSNSLSRRYTIRETHARRPSPLFSPDFQSNLPLLRTTS